MRRCEEFLGVSWHSCILKAARAGLSILPLSSSMTGISLHTWEQTSFPVCVTFLIEKFVCMYLCKGVCVREELLNLQITFFFSFFQYVSELIFKASVHIGKMFKKV